MVINQSNFVFLQCTNVIFFLIHPHFLTCPVPPRDVPILWRSRHFVESRRKQISRQTVISMQRKGWRISLNTRAIQSNWTVMGSEVSNPAFMWWMLRSFKARLAEEPRGQFGKATLALGGGRGTCSRMCSCISMAALWTRCEGSCCVCVLASVNLTCWFGRAAQELLIQQLHVVGWKANSTLLDRQTKKKKNCSSLHGISIHLCLFIATPSPGVDPWFYRAGFFLFCANRCKWLWGSQSFATAYVCNFTGHLITLIM